jgi:hypothetical protein
MMANPTLLACWRFSLWSSSWIQALRVHVEDCASGETVQIVTLGQRQAHGRRHVALRRKLARSDLRKHPELQLGVVRTDQNAPGRRHEGSSDRCGIARDDARQVLAVGPGRAEAPALGTGDLQLAMQSARDRVDEIQQGPSEVAIQRGEL